MRGRRIHNELAPTDLRNLHKVGSRYRVAEVTVGMTLQDL
jgi:hypothetical protein